MSAIGATRHSALGELADELRESIHAFVQSRSPEAEVRRLMETDEGFDAAVWSQMAEQLGLQGLTIPEQLRRLRVLARRAGGRARGDGPRADVHALLLDGRSPPRRIVASGDDAACEEYLPGHRRRRDASPRWPSPRTTADWDLEGDPRPAPPSSATAAPGSTARRPSSSTATRPTCSSSSRADATPACRSSSSTATPPGCAARRWPRSTRRASRPASSSTARRPGSWARTGAAGAVIDRVLDLAAVALAAEQVGGAPACLDMTRRVRQGPGPVRPPDRLVPGDQAQVRRHAARDRAGPRRPTRRLVPPPRADDERRSVASVAKAYCSEAYSTRPRRTSRSTAASASPGSTPPPVLPARQVQRTALRRPRLTTGSWCCSVLASRRSLGAKRKPCTH